MSAELASPARARFRLSSLGETCLTRESDDGLTEELLRGGKVLALLIYVACQEGRPVSREELSDLLWGDESPVNARASLRQALYALRRLVGEQVLGGDRHHVTLAPDAIAFDRDRFVLGARSGDLATMLEAYRGAFCPTLEVGEARRILEWMEEERHRLRHLLLDVAHRALPQLLRSGPATQALTAARRVHQLVPDDLVTFILLVDALIAAGSIDEARERVTSAVAIRRVAGEGIPEPLRTRVQRLARHDPDAAPLRGTLDALGHTLVGREAPIQQLLVEAERARLGEPRRIVVTGSMGIGKTRLLDEVEARLRLRGARVIRVRLLPAMREVPYAALADLVRALVQLPGSLGIAEGAARELVTLLPELSARYPNATPINREEGDRRLPRREALGDLLAAVADERLVVILLDDVGWADEPSRQVIAGVTRGARLRLLEVLTTRPGWSLEELSAERQLPLQPLLPEELRFLLEEVAPLPTVPWADALIAQLAHRSRGIPQAILQLIRSAAAAGYLVPTPGGWRSDDPDRLLTEVSTRSWLDEGFADLSPMALRLLTLLARWVRPIDERELIALIRGIAARSSQEEVTEALRRLETLGLVISRDTSWEVAHASVADAALARAVEGEAQVTLEHLVRFWGDPGRLDVELLEHLALLVGTGGERSLLLRIAQAAARAPRIRAVELRGRRLARRIARAAGHPEWEGECLGAMGFLARQEGWGLAMVGASSTLVVGGLLWLAVMLQPRLRFEVEPLAEGPTVGAIDLSVQPRIVLENGFGRRYRWPILTELSSDEYEVIGDTRRPLEEGQAQFERIAIRVTTEDRARDAVLRAVGPWFVRAATAPVRGSRTLATNGVFHVIAAKVDDVPLAPDLSVVVPPGDSLRLTLTFAYTTSLPTSNYVVGALPTWGRREREVVRLAGLPSPVFDAWRTVEFSVPPPPRGTHHIVLLFAAEDGVDYLFSLTNWTYGRPSWYDGNDVPDLGVEAFETLRRQGYLSDIPYRHARHAVRLARSWFPLRESPPMEAVYDLNVRLTGTAIRVTVDSTVARPRPG